MRDERRGYAETPAEERFRLAAEMAAVRLGGIPVISGGIPAASGSSQSLIGTPALAGGAYPVFAPSEQQAALQAEIRRLQTEVANKARELNQAGLTEAKRKEEFDSLQRAFSELAVKQELQHLTNRVSRKAEPALLKDSSCLKTDFAKDELRPAYVMSIDIRRSTELMLKARKPELFAGFITDLSIKLGETIKENYGVFDKFTGDGILAFFPEFYSGPDAGFLTIKAADECHEVFATHYAANRGCFISVLKGTGLGIGIDYGDVKFVRVLDGLTVVGTPVVYACRMGGANGGQTFLNQPAYEMIFEKFSAYCNFRETEIDLKHEGTTVAYAVSRNEKDYLPAEPDWQKTMAPGQEVSAAQ